VSQITQHLEDFQREARQVARRAGPWIEAFARIGYGAKGVVYLLIGLIALLSAIGMGAGVADQRGVMRTLLAQPFGKTMLLAMAAGLSCYALWYFVQAILDPERSGMDWKGLGKRIGYFIKGVVHAALVVAIVRLIIGLKSQSSTDSAARDWTARVMAFPLGIWLVGATGVGVLGYGFYQLYRAWKIRLDQQLELGSVRPTSRSLIIMLSRFGLFARAVVFGTIGFGLLIAAIRANPREAKGVAAALLTLEHQPYGSLLLGAVGLGLASYGVYQFARAKYRRIGP
jgi:hypothetical protein